VGPPVPCAHITRRRVFTSCPTHSWTEHATSHRRPIGCLDCRADGLYDRPRRSGVANPRTTGTQPGISASTSGPATPPFNNEIILRDVTGGGAFGHVKFRQPKDDDVIVYLDTWCATSLPHELPAAAARGHECR